jgi:curved DNA-binding protein CbpA
MSEAATDINPYELLGIQNESTEAEIRKAYRQQSLKVHPDRVSCFQVVWQK